MAAAFRQPLIPAVLAYCAGCCAAHVFDPALPPAALGATALLLAVGAVAALVKNCGTAAAICMFSLLLVAGFFRIELKLHPDPSANLILGSIDAPRTLVEAVITEPAAHTPLRTRLKLSTRALHTPGGALPCTGNLLLSIKQTDRDFTFGDRILFPATLHRPKNFSNPGGFDYIRHLAYRDTYATAFLKNDQAITKLAGSEAGVLGMVEAARSRIRTAIKEQLGPPSRDMLLALIIGEQGTIPEDLRSRFSALGITHILSISGLHVSIFSLITYGLLFNLLRLYPRLLLHIPAKKIALFLSVFPVLGYCLIAGMATPAARSGLMVACYLLTLLLDRPQSQLHTLFVAAFAILAVSPQSLFDISFQLSFMAVFCLVVLVPAWSRFFKTGETDPFSPASPLKTKAVSYVRDSLLTSAAALLGTAPLVACYFYTFAPAGLIANIIMVPLAGFVIVPLGLAAALTLFVCPPVAHALFSACGYGTDLFVSLADLLYEMIGSAFVVTKPLLWEMAAFYGLLFASTRCLTRRHVLMLAAACLALAGVDCLYNVFWARPDGIMRVTFLDVGAGDAAVVQMPEGQVMLVDGGGLMDDSFDTGKAVIAPYLYTMGIKKIDYTIMTHPHRDHAGGLPHLARQFGFSEFWHNGSSLYLDSYQALTALARETGTAVIDCSGRAQPRRIGPVSIAFFNPAHSATHDPEQANNDSLVMKLGYGRVSFLFSADILYDAESALAASGADLRASVLKVPHHGGQSSACGPFLDAVRPEMAVVSGRAFGNRQAPHPLFAERLQERHIPTYVTGRCGAVTVTTDGNTMNVETFLPGCTGGL